MDKLGRYQITGELGRGGCGVVYRAVDPSIGRQVAIKTIVANPDEDPTSANDLLIRLRREAQSAGVLSHPNIVTVHELADQGEITYIVMEHVSGENLKQVMARNKTLPDDRILTILKEAADALDHAHLQGVVHRDVKPANFILSDRGPLKITDFGIAKLISGETSGITQTGMMIGTMHYMAPEQIALKPVNGKTDQFALAVIAYELLTGQKPFQGDSAASIIHQVMTADPPPVEQFRKSLGPDATRVLRRAMAKEAADRYPNCRAFVTDIEGALRHPERVTATLQAPTGTMPAAPRTWNKPGFVWPLALLAAVLLASQAYRLFSPGPAPPPSFPAPDQTAAASAPQLPTPKPRAAAPPTVRRAPVATLPAHTGPPPKAATVPETKPPDTTAEIPAAPAPPPPEVNANTTPEVPDPELPPGGKYRGPPEGSFTWTGTLGRQERLSLAGNRASSGMIPGRGLPVGLAVSVEVAPREVRVLEQPSASNRYRLVLSNSGNAVSAITVRWRERRD